MKLHENKWMRSFILPALRLVAFDFSITHHWTGDKLFLNSFRHKSYWYHGRQRENVTMELFSRLIGEGETVVEIGGHIGYISLWFLKLVGPKGEVIVFEPGLNNLPYTRRNLEGWRNVLLVEKACGAADGELVFFEDNISGQNNSFLKNFKAAKTNAMNIPGVRLSLEPRKAPVCRLDSFMAKRGRLVNFVKIDTEGYELAVLQGCATLLQQNPPPKFMVEVQRGDLESEKKIFALFEQKGYRLFDESGRRSSPGKRHGLNLFILHPLYHREAMVRWLGEASNQADLDQ